MVEAQTLSLSQKNENGPILMHKEAPTLEAQLELYHQCQDHWIDRE
jgi:hypothetical protein